MSTCVPNELPTYLSFEFVIQFNFLYPSVQEQHSGLSTPFNLRSNTNQSVLKALRTFFYALTHSLCE